MSSTVHDLAILLRLRLRLLLRSAQKSGRRQPRQVPVPGPRAVGLGALFLVLCLAAVSLGNGLRALVANESGRAAVGAALIGIAPAVFVILFAAAIPVVLAVFTYRSDLRLLLLTPISPRLLMAEKILSTCLGFTPFLLVIGCPILLAIGQAVELGPGYDALAIVILLLLPVAPVSLVTLIAVGVLHWIPPARARTVTAALSLLFGLTGYLGSQLAFRGRRAEGLRYLLTAQSNAWWSTLPPTWPGHVLAAAAAGDLAATLAYLVATLLFCGLVVGLAIVLSAHLFATGWATYQEVGRRAPAPRVDVAPSAFGTIERSPWARTGLTLSNPSPLTVQTSTLAAAFQPGWWPLVRKEWLSFRRDPQVWTRPLYTFVGLGIAVYGLVSGPGPAAGRVGTISPVLVYDGAVIFFVYVLLSTLAGPIVNREGRAFMLLRLSPLSSRDILRAKWAFCALPGLVVAVLLCVGNLVLGRAILTAVIAGVALGGFAVALVGGLITINLIWPRFDWDNPARAVSGTGQLAGGIGGLILTASVIGLLSVASVASFAPIGALAVVLLVGIEGSVSLLSAAIAPGLLGRLLDGERESTAPDLSTPRR